MVVLHACTAVLLTPVVESETTGTCLSQEMRQTIIENLTASVQATLDANISSYVFIPNCGPGLWHQVAHLNMSDPSQHCPSAWREYNIDGGVRFCIRPQASSGSCPDTSYTTGQQYSKVCGRAIGYQIETTKAFGYQAINQTIDSYYVYGVSVTHGAPRNHIWTFAAGFAEEDYGFHPEWNCPCSNFSHPDNQFPPSFVGDNYFCESGNPIHHYYRNCYYNYYYYYYSNDPLWDGQQCEGQCCSNGKSPPWFSVDLPSTTADDIEVRICGPEGTYNHIALQLLEIFVQ